MEARTIHHLILSAADARPAAAFQLPAPGAAPVTYGAFADEVRAAARGLVALGIVPGDRVALVAENSPLWLRADLATLAAGAIDVPRGLAAPPVEVAVIAAHAGARAAFVADAAALARYADALAGLAPVVVLAGPAPAGSAALTWDELLRRGRASSSALPEVLPSAVATLIYTSGTTGEPKGVTLTHANITANVRMLEDVLDPAPGETFLCVLPPWHAYERTVEYYAATRGAVLAYTDVRRLRDDLVAFGPQFLASVPRIWESFHDAVRAEVRKLPSAKRRLVESVLRGALRHERARRAMRGETADAADGVRPLAARLADVLARIVLAPARALAGRTVFRKVRDVTGGRLRVAISGGAALPPHVDLFFGAAGLDVLVGYGLTETSPVVAVRRVERNVLGTIGTPLAGTELAIEAGELLVRGPQVMQGYWRNDTATARVLAGGWFRTGDLCRLTRKGDIVFVGRAKDTIVLAGGENVEPEPIEQAALVCASVGQIVVVGQDRKTLAALVWPRDGRAVDAAAVRAEIDAALRATGSFRPWERVARVVLLPQPLAVDDGTLTATLKVRRAVVAEKYRELIETAWE